MLRPAFAIIKRELIATLRNRNCFWFMATVMSLLVGALVLFLLSSERIDMGDPYTMGLFTAGIFLGYAYTLYGAAVLLVATVASNAICSEKQQDQLDLVRMTYISPAVFLLGKGANILGLFLLAVIVTLPLAGIMFFFTGIDWLQYLQMLALVSMSALSAAAIGLLCSSYFYRTITSAMTTYGLIAFAQGIFGFVVTFLLYQTNLNFSMTNISFATLMNCALVPVAAILRLVDTGFPPSVMVASAIYHGAIILVCGTGAYILLTRPTKPMRVNAVKTTDDVHVLETRRKKFPYYLIDPQRRRPLIGDRQNPILAKERFSSMAGRGTTSIRLLYSMAIIAAIISTFVAAITVSPQDTRVAVQWIITLEMILLLSIIPTYIATTFPKEHESGNWDMMRMTQLTPREIVWGKIFGALQGLALPGSALFLGTLPLLECAMRVPSAGTALISGAALTIVAVIYALALGINVSVRRERSLSALVLCWLASFVIFLVFPTLCFIFNEFLPRWEQVSNESLFFYFSPLTTQLAGFNRYQPIQGNLVQIIIFLGVSMLLIFWAQFQCRRLLGPGSLPLRAPSAPTLDVPESVQ